MSDSIKNIQARAEALERLKKRQFTVGASFVNRLTGNKLEKKIRKLESQLQEDQKTLRDCSNSLDETSDNWSLNEEVAAEHISKLKKRINRLM